jgi:YesN/AraC family two-component response regulator
VILTGYPDFEAALQAIRNQVDDYAVKPVEPEELVKLVRQKLQAPARAHRPPATKRVADIIRDNKEHIMTEWLKVTRSHPEFQSTSVSDDERLDHLPKKLDELVTMLESHSRTTSGEQLRAAFLHGEARRRQGYSAEMIVEETRLVETCIFNTVQANLLNINISQLIPDLIHITDSSQRQLRQSLHAFFGERVTEIRTGDDKSLAAKGTGQRLV